MRIFLLIILALSMSNAWAYSDGKDQRMIERKTRQLTREAERLARQSEPICRTMPQGVCLSPGIETSGGTSGGAG